MYNLQILQKSLYERNSHKNCQMAKRAWVCVQADEHGAFITKRTNISLDRLYSNNHKLPSGDAFSVHSSVSTIEGNFLQNDCHLGEGSVLVIYIYISYTIFSNVFCLFFCQIFFPYQDSHMQIICGNAGS